MRNIDKYYDNTKNSLPNFIVRKFVEMGIKPGKAIDLGCGIGRDTIYLIKNGWEVLSIDREDVKERILDRLDDEQIKRFKFEVQNFENIKLQKTNLLMANYSIPFCSKNYFYQFWSKITDSILKERIFCRKFFWLK